MTGERDGKTVVSAIDALIARLMAGLTAVDRRLGWTAEDAALWVEVLNKTKAGVLSDPPHAHELWLVGGVARQLDYLGTTDGELAEALYSLAIEVGKLGGGGNDTGLVFGDQKGVTTAAALSVAGPRSGVGGGGGGG